MRLSSRAAVLLALALIFFALTFVDAQRLAEGRSVATKETKELARRLGLTDIALFTEARYTRHPTQADLHSALQDHPLAIEHFPTGSLIPPPHHDAVDRETARAD